MQPKGLASPSARRPTVHATSTSEAVDALLDLFGDRADRASTARAVGRASPFTAPVLLIDGRSGSGKTALADALAPALWPHVDAQVVHLDDIYPGWNGLDAASVHIHEHLLSGETPRWQRYDWANERPAEWASVDPRRPLIVEGIGSLSRQNAALATITLWLELDEKTRRSRAIARDGASYEPHWAAWAEHEDEFIARENPAALADAIVDFGR